MLDLGRFEINRTHAVEVDSPLVVIEVMLRDPRKDPEETLEKDLFVPVRAGATVRLVLEDGTRTAFSGETDDDGYVQFAVTEALENIAIEIDFTGHEFLDLEEQVLLPAAEVNLLDKRPLVRMPDVWRSDLEPEVFDALGGRFANGRIPRIEPDGQGNETTPWVIRIDHAWQSLGVAFEHYDTEAHAVARIDRGGVLEAFEGTTFAPSTLVGATSVEKDNVRPLRLFRRVAPESLCLRVRLPDHTFVDLSEPFGPDRNTTSSAPVPLSTQLKRYPLPSLWLSRGQFITTAGDDSKRTFEQAAASALDSSDTVVFDLDDVLLVDNEGTPIDIEKTLPVTVFGRDFAVKNPDPTDAQFSKHTIDAAHLRGRDVYYDGTEGSKDSAPKPHRVTRVIRRGRKFYHLDGTRSSAGRVIGIRRALRDAHPVVRRPVQELEGAVNFRGEIHYFNDIGVVHLEDPNDSKGPPDTRRLGVALVFVSLKIRRFNLTVTDTDEDNTRQALVRAAERWTGQPLDVVFAPSTPEHASVFSLGPGDQATKFVFHFPSVEGKALINCFLHKPSKKKSKKELAEDRKLDPNASEFETFRAHAFLHHIALDTRDDLLPTTENGEADEVGGTALPEVVAHELGHILGLPDEYMEDIDQDSITIPRHRQGTRAIQFKFQQASMMKGNVTPMLRHFWHLADVLARGEGTPKGPSVIYSDTRESKEPGPSARVHRYAMPPEHPSPFVLFRELDIGHPDARHTARLALLGDDYDESAESREATATLLISPRLAIKIKRLSLSEPDSIFPKDDRVSALTTFARALPKRFHEERLVLELKSSTSAFVKTHLSKIYLAFHPRFSRRTPLTTDVRIRLDRNHADSPADDFSKDKWRVTDRTPPIRVVRALLGLDANANQPPHIEVLGQGGGNITFHSGGTTIALKATDTRTGKPPKKNAFRFAIQDSPGIVEPVPIDVIAQNIADAINLESNDFHHLANATAVGAKVSLTPKGPSFHMNAGSNYEIENEFVETLEPSDLASLAQQVGELVGGTYTVVRVPS